MKFQCLTEDSNKTKELGFLLSRHLFVGAVVTLTGDLGAGKTTFTTGVAKGLGINEKVNSPTFNILKCYFSTPLSLFHIDAYRLNEGNKDIGLEEFIEGDGVCFIEWPNFIEELIDETQVLNVDIKNCGDNLREITFTTQNSKYSEFFKCLEAK